MPIVRAPLYGKAKAALLPVIVRVAANPPIATTFLVDSGSTYSFMSKALWDRLRVKPNVVGASKKIQGLGGHFKSYAYGPIAITLRNPTHVYRFELERIWHPEGTDLKMNILGWDFLEKYGTIVTINGREGFVELDFNSFDLEQEIRPVIGPTKTT